MKLLKLLPVAALTLVMGASCSNKTTGAADNTDAFMPLGDWTIETLAVNDTLSLNPLEIDSATAQIFTFNADSTYGIQTNCNEIAGEFVINGDSIVFDPAGMGTATLMMCPDMTVEDNLKAILPQVGSYTLDVTTTPGDTILTLTTNTPSQYIKLKKK